MHAFCKQVTSIYEQYYLDANTFALFLSCLIRNNDPLLHKLPLIFRFHCNELLFSQREKL